jgi:serine/threonine-protein kinase HipA
MDTTDTTRVHVYKDARRVGVLSSDAVGRLAFAYDEAVLDDPSAAVSVRLPLRRPPYPDHQALPCFENLLPEGDLRQLLARSVHRSEGDVVGLLGVFGGECAGALSLWPEGTMPPASPTYRPCTAADVHDAFGVARDEAHLARTLRDGRLSMSGAQDKLVLYRRPAVGLGPNESQPRYALPVAGAPSTVLVKRERGRFPGLVHNELACMDLMRAAGVPTAFHAPHALDGGLYEMARFDRVLNEDGSVVRHHAEDGCQLTGRTSLAKYAHRNGPTYAELVSVLNRHGLAPLEDGELLYRWAVANLALGNRDGHAKNVSVLHVQPMIVRLAPAYDVVCTLVYPTLDDELPLRFGGQLTVAALTPRSLAKAAREFRLAPARARDLMAAVCDGIVAALPDALDGVEKIAGRHAVLERLDVTVREQTTLVRRALLGE